MKHGISRGEVRLILPTSEGIDEKVMETIVGVLGRTATFVASNCKATLQTVRNARLEQVGRIRGSVWTGPFVAKNRSAVSPEKLGELTDAFRSRLVNTHCQRQA